MNRKGGKRRVARAAMIALGLGAASVLITVGLLHEGRPRGAEPEKAEQAVDRMFDVLDVEAWNRTGAIQWTFPRGHAHLWDRTRNLSRVRWSDIEVLQHLDRREGRAWEGGSEVTDERRRELIDQAWAYFANDSFWLAAPFKARDEGTTRSWATVDGVSGALIQYASGGVTPGDAYLWILGQDDRPTRWRMWVSILPVGGIGVSWEGWTQLSTGAWVATTHEFDYVPFRVELEDVAAGASVGELAEQDPFALLLSPPAHRSENGNPSGP